MRLIAGLPEVTGAVIFLVCTTSDIFIEYFHEPTDIVQPFAPGIDQYINLVGFVRFQVFAVDIFLRDFFRFVQLMPSVNDVFDICAFGFVASSDICSLRGFSIGFTSTADYITKVAAN